MIPIPSPITRSAGRRAGSIARCAINGALFWEDWNKVQYTEPGILGIQYTVNAGKARSQAVSKAI